MTDRIISIGLKLYSLLVFMFIFVPIILFVVFSFGVDRYPSLVWRGATLEWYHQVFDDPSIRSSFINSVKVALSVSLLSTFIGSTFAYFVNRWNFKGKSILLAIAVIPPCIPLIVLGLSLSIFLNRIGLGSSLLSIVISQTVICSAFSMAIVRLRLTQMDQTLEQVSWNLGYGEWETIARVLIPQIAPALVTSIFLTMAISFDEFVVAWFVSGLDVTLPVKIYAMLGGDVSPKINAIGSMAFGVSITLVVIAQLVWELYARRVSQVGPSAKNILVRNSEAI
jgi:spermidine/putrescine transport system permease protein